MRRLRYNAAMSLDGYIAGPNGEYDWIVEDPSIDFGALFASFDTVIMGRKTFVAALAHARDGILPGMADKEVFVCSRTLSPADYPKVTIIADKAGEAVATIKANPGKAVAPSFSA
jgi:dihydrofolate reductase